MATPSDPEAAPERTDDQARAARQPEGTTPFSEPRRITDVGAFMCRQPSEPPVERVDVPSQRDLKQEAVLVLLARRAERGDDLCLGCEQLVNRDPGLAWTAYAQARVDFYRARRGRQRGAARVESLDARGEEVAAVPAEEPAEEVTSPRIVRRIVRERLPGISERRLQRVMVTMTEAQQFRRRDRAAMPDKLRRALSRLRKATGLPLDTSLL